MYKFIISLVLLSIVSITTFAQNGSKEQTEAEKEKERYLQACFERRFRIAPLPVDLMQEKPAFDRCRLPSHEAFQRCRIIDVVAMPDRYCWGVLVVSYRQDWLKVKFGNLIPVLTIGATYIDQNDTKWHIHNN